MTCLHMIFDVTMQTLPIVSALDRVEDTLCKSGGPHWGSSWVRRHERQYYEKNATSKPEQTKCVKCQGEHYSASIPPALSSLLTFDAKASPRWRVWSESANGSGMLEIGCLSHHRKYYRWLGHQEFHSPVSPAALALSSEGPSGHDGNG